MKKLLSTMLVMCIIVSLFNGCDTKPESTDTSATSDNTQSISEENVQKAEDISFEITPQLIGNPNGSIEITWQPNASHSLAASSEERVKYLSERMLEWCKQNPEVKITVIASTGNNQENAAKMLMQADQGRAPDFASIDSFMLPRFYPYLQPIDSYVAAQNVDISDWFDFASSAMKPEDKTLALWYTTDVRSLYYNKNLISDDKVPETWDELITVGKEMKAQGYDGFIYTAGRNESAVTNHLPYLWAQGYDIVDAEGNAIFGEEPTKTGMINWFNFFKRTIDEGITPARVTTFEKDADMNSEIASGKVAMFLGSNALAPQLREILGDKFDETWGVAPIPQMETGKRVTTAGGYVTGFFTEDAQKLEIATDFIFFVYCGDEGMTNWCKYGGYLPPRKSIYDLDEYFAKDPYMLAFKEELDYARTRPAVELYPAISEELQVQIGKVITGESSPEKAVDDAWENIKKS